VPWHRTVIAKLEAARIFAKVELVGGMEKFRELKSYPHHFQKRLGETWIFEESPMRGNIESEIELVIEHLRAFLS
jgi:hypothetical protein